MRFFRCGAGKVFYIHVTDTDRWYADGSGKPKLAPANGCVTATEKANDPAYRELTAAEFLRETRGKPISDKALELVAEERGCRCYSHDTGFEGFWIEGRETYLYVVFVLCEVRMLPPRNGARLQSDLSTILASKPGKRHREAIEQFILSLPVVTHETQPAAKQWTLLDVVRGVADTGICGYWRRALEATPASEWSQFFDERVDGQDGDELYDWCYAHLGVWVYDFDTDESYKLAIARKLGLVGEETQPERGDYVIVTPTKIVHHVIKVATLQEAEAALLEQIRGAHGATLSLRQLGPAIKTLRSVEERRWNIEEVPNVPSN